MDIDKISLITYNPNCLYFDSYLGVCGHSEGNLMACREEICPLKGVNYGDLFL